MLAVGCDVPYELNEGVLSMMEPAADAPPLQGQTVAFTGKLASMSRAQAAELVGAYGGQWAPSVTRHTSLLVVGQEGWPLAKDGRLSSKLRKARQLQQSQRLEVITESD